MFPPGTGGSERYAAELADALGAQGHRVDVYTQRIPNCDNRVSHHENVQIYRLTRARRPLVTFETLYYSLRARRSVDFNQYDVIHGTLMPASTIALTPRLSIEPPIVLTSHGTAIDEALSHVPEVPTDYLKRYFFHPMNAIMDTIAGRSANHLIAISEATRERLLSTYRFPPEKVSLIPHGVDTDHFRPTPHRHPAFPPPETPTLLFVGRLVARKGADRAIKALATLPNQDCVLLIAGTGSHEDRLQRLARSLGVADRVRFLGFIPEADLPCLYASAHVVLVPSRYEGFGLVVLEAMACGTPVIATPVGGVPDILHNGGGIISPHDPQGIAAAIETLLASPDRRTTMAKAARRRATEMQWTTVAAEVETLYTQLLEDTDQPGRAAPS